MPNLMGHQRRGDVAIEMVADELFPVLLDQFSICSFFFYNNKMFEFISKYTTVLMKFGFSVEDVLSFEFY